MQDKLSDDQPFLPPRSLLLLALAAGLAALLTFAINADAVVAWGALGIALLALLGWGFTAPQQVRAVLTGRTLRFGGTSLLVTLVVLAALVAIYTFVRQANLSVTLSESNEYALSSEGRSAIAAIGADPTLPPVHVTTFISATSAGIRDQLELLMEEYVSVSQGKVISEFVDLDRNPLRAEQMGAANPNQQFVTRLNAEGQPDLEEGELLRFFSQDGLTNAILRNAVAGDFRTWFIEVQDGPGMNASGPEGLSTLSLGLEQQLDWTNREVPLLDFTRPESELRLNDPAIDGEIMIIAGGSRPLSEPELAVLTDYLDGGGKLILLAAPGLETGSAPLAADAALGDWLYQHFGLRFRNDMVLDRSQAFQNPLYPVSTDMDAYHRITQPYSQGFALVFEAPHSIEIAEQPPASVTLTSLASSSPDSYNMRGFSAVLEGNIEPEETSLTGPLVLAAAAENSETGARVVLFGSTSMLANGFTGINGVANFDVAVDSIFWATDFEDWFSQVNIQSAARPQDAPLFADAQSLALINVITSLLLPFGVLAIGALVWYRNRESAPQGGQ
ncbi:MAG: hypothetical protein OXH77_00785 [Anaerolineaceae bacterium]|nr:hypothetical protein [Anaerolineaceae bacterium]